VSSRRLENVLGDCRKTLRGCRLFAADAYNWSIAGSKPHISKSRRDWITETAFLRAFLAFEMLLEETFILYATGHQPSRGRPPLRLVQFPSRSVVEEWIVPEGRSYASWQAGHVQRRAQRFFKDGKPFAAALAGSQNALDEARVLRNAVAHKSSSAQEKFEALVRAKLGSLPLSITVGGFLLGAVPGVTPPTSFLEYYLGRLEGVAQQIVP